MTKRVLPDGEIPPLSRYVRPSFEDERTLESLFDEQNFWYLYELTQAICLVQRPDIEAVPVADSVEARIVARIGAVGLRQAYEVVQKGARVCATNPWTEEELVDETRDYPDIEPIHRPDYFGHGTDLNILRHVEALGGTLLDEGFGCLGAEGPAMAEKYRNAKDDKAQIAVLQWLHERLYAMMASKRGIVSEYTVPDDDDEEDTAGSVASDSAPRYHPARFSPKFIGRHPNYNLSPTCLGVEIIAGGFLKKAGAEFMRAGVMRTPREALWIEAMDLIYRMPEICRDMGVSYSPFLREQLRIKAATLYDFTTKDHGSHAALMVRLKSGDWFQYDSNYDLSTVVSDDLIDDISADGLDDRLTDRLSGTYSALQDFASIAPSMELSLDTGIVGPAAEWARYVRGLEMPPAVREDLDAILQTLPDESTFEPLREYIVDRWIMQPASEFHVSMQEQYCLPVDETEADILPRPIDNAFYNMLDVSVLRDKKMDARSFALRCKTDPYYRARLVDDLMCIPAIMGVALTLEMTWRKTYDSLHRVLELGRPEINVGFAALNNIAIYTGEPLSAHFWFSYWPNRDVVSDKLSLGERSRAQGKAVNNVMMHALTHLNYSRNYSIVDSFLRQDNSDS